MQFTLHLSPGKIEQVCYKCVTAILDLNTN